MSSQRLFEGPDVRALLDEITTTYGSEPTISRAETFRTGGVMGFFQREHYRLVVNEPNVLASTGAGAAVGPRSAAPLGSPLRSPVTGAEAVATYSVAALATAPAERELTAADYLATLDSPGASTLTPSSSDPFASLADATVDETVVGPVARAFAPGLSAEPGSGWVEPAMPEDNVTFDDILRRVATMVDAPDAEPVEWPRLARGDGPAGDALDAVPGGSAGSAESIAEDDDLPVVRTANRQAAAILAALASAEAFADQAQFRLASGFTSVWSPADIAAGDREGNHPRSGVKAAIKVDYPAEDQGLIGRLTEVGLEPGVARSVAAGVATGRSLEAAIVDAMASLPAAARPAPQPGSVIVVVGPRTRAEAEAQRISAEVGNDPAQVAFVRSARDASGFVAERSRDRVGVVSIAAPAGAKSTVLTWARRLMDEVAPTEVVAVVDAMHKNEDLANWIIALGGVDTLVVDNLASTSTPARILELGLPVARLDKHPASPSRWAAAILDRVPDESIPEVTRVAELAEVADLASLQLGADLVTAEAQ